MHYAVQSTPRVASRNFALPLFCTLFISICYCLHLILWFCTGYSAVYLILNCESGCTHKFIMYPQISACNIFEEKSSALCVHHCIKCTLSSLRSLSYEVYIVVYTYCTCPLISLYTIHFQVYVWLDIVVQMTSKVPVWILECVNGLIKDIRSKCRFWAWLSLMQCLHSFEVLQ